MATAAKRKKTQNPAALINTAKIKAMAQFAANHLNRDLDTYLPEIPMGLRVEIAADAGNAFAHALDLSLREHGVEVVK